jgi:hypothetical protein
MKKKKIYIERLGSLVGRFLLESYNHNELGRGDGEIINEF